MNDDRKFEERKKDFLNLIKLGFPSFIIEEMLSISSSTVVNYLKKLRALGEFKGELPLKKESGKILFEAYLKMSLNLFKAVEFDGKEFADWTSLQGKFKEKLEPFLKKILKIEEIKNHLDMILSISNNFTTIKFDKDFNPSYKELLEFVYPEMVYPYGNEDCITGDIIFKVFSEDVLSGKVDSFGRNLSIDDFSYAVKEMLTVSLIEQARKNLAPVVTKEFQPVIDVALARLPKINSEVIEKLFGLNCERVTLTQLAKEKNLSVITISNRKNKSLSMLYMFVDKSLFNPISDALSEKLLVQKKHEEKIAKKNDYWIEKFSTLEENLNKDYSTPRFSDDQINCLIKPLLNCNFEARTYHAFYHRGYEYAYEILIESEIDLLKVRNFGKKSLNLLKDWAETHDLSLNLKLNDAEIQYIKYMIELKAQ